MYSKAPDDDVFVELATTYSLNHPTMHKGQSVCGDRFKNGMVK